MLWHIWGDSRQFKDHFHFGNRSAWLPPGDCWLELPLRALLLSVPGGSLTQLSPGRSHGATRPYAMSFYLSHYDNVPTHFPEISPNSRPDQEV